MRKFVGLCVLCLGTSVNALAQVDTSYIYNTQTAYGTLDLRLAKSPTRYYYLQEGVTFSYRESAPGVKTNTYTSMVTWNTSAYGEGNLREKNGNSDYFTMNYRLLKPQNYNPDYESGYPIIIMLHGGGEAGNCWIDTRCYWASSDYNPVINSPPAPTDENHHLLNNDRNLLHGGAQHLTAVNLAGSKLPDDPTLSPRAFPGFVLFPQSLNGWGPRQVEDAIRILRLIIKKYNIDESRVYIHGLSNGGGGVYVALKRAPWLFAAALPMSAVYDGGIINQGYTSEVAKLPLWIFQGGQDIAPTPSQTYHYVRSFRNAGADVRYYLYPNLGHGTWNTAYAEPDFFSWILEKRKYNPHVAFGNPVICNTTETGVTLGFSKGFFGYQWERDGAVLPDEAGAELIANVPGTYRGRFSRKPNPSEDDWERWSDPIVVSEMNPEKPQVEVIGTAHLRGPGLSSTNDNNTVKLKSAEPAELYQWYKNGNLLAFPGTNVEDTLRVAPFTSASTGANGAYTLVTKNNNCPSPPSDPINLFFNGSSPQNITISGENVNFRGTAAASSIFLSWNDVSTAESGYEIWRRKAGTSDFRFVVKTGEDAVSYHDVNLDPGTTYEYKIRAVNNTGRSNYLPSDDPGINYQFKTSGDFHYPPPPQNLKVLSNTLNTISLSWDAARDESSVKEYYVYYQDDSVSTGSNATAYTITGLAQNTVYPVRVKAVDYGNHLSQASNQVIATTYLSGLIYKHSTGAWESLDDSAMVATFLSPEFTGTVPNFTLQPRTQDDYFNFEFTGYVNITTEGTYYFNVTSNDGSRLFLDGKMIVDNDGIHNNRTVASDAIYLTTGPHAIKVQYFDDVAGHVLNVRYKGPGVGDGVNFIDIPDAALRSGTYIPPAPPAAPTQTSATAMGMERIDLAWQYSDDGQTDYEVYRSTASSGPFTIVARVAGTSAADTIGLIPGSKYYYKVKAVSTKGSSNYSNTASATTATDAIAPTVPSNLVLISKTLTNLAFSWDPSTDNVAVTKYEVFAGAKLIGQSDIHAFTAEDLSPNTEYVFTVKAVDASGNRSAASAQLVVVTNSSATFYSLASGNLNDLNSWRKNADGTGDAPANFSDNGQFFVISNRTETSLGGAWVIGGSSSRVIIPTGVTLTADYPFSANVELEGNAVLNLDNAEGPHLVRMASQSTVNFNEYPFIEANTYGNIILSGTAMKTFDGDTLDVLGNITVHDGISLKGSPHNSTCIRLSGTMTLLGTRPATAADNTIDLVFTGTAAQALNTESNLEIYRITTSPGQTVSIVNPAGVPVDVTLGSLKGGGLVLANGSALVVSSHNLSFRDAAVANPGNETGTISVSGGDLAITSTSAKNSNLYFDASQNTVRTLMVDLRGTGTVVARSPLQISDGIKIHNGTLASEGNIALIASAEHTAAIREIENQGRITGEVTVQQYMPAKGSALSYLSAPVNSVTVSEWQQSFPVTGPFTGSSGGTDPSLFKFDAVTGGWLEYPPSGGANTAAIEQGVGYAARLSNDEPITVVVNGNPYQGSIALNVTGGGEEISSNVWNLVGNPYASPLVWGGEDGWEMAGVNHVIAIRKDTIVSGIARSQISYYDPQLGGGIIPAGQAFWVRTVAASPALVVKETAKVDPEAEAPLPPATKYLVVSLKQGDLADPAYILFTDEGTDGYDAQLDGRKLPNQGMFNFSTLTMDTVSLAVNNVSGAYCSKAVGLNVKDVSPGSYSISFANLESLTDVGVLTLADHFTATSATITGADYSFTVTDDPASYGASRFVLTFAKEDVDITTPQVTGGDVCAPGPGAVLVSHSQAGALYQVTDLSGKVISDFVEGNGGDIEISLTDGGLASGSNKVLVTSGFYGCDRKTLPGEVTLNFVTSLTVTTPGDVSMCEGDDVTLEASGAPVGGGFYRWFDADGVLIEGANESTLLVTEVLTEAVYYVAAAHPDGCESPLEEIHIYPDSLDMPVILVKDDTLYTDVVGYYQWKKDGEEIPGATVAWYVPTADGQYSVLASNGGCLKESEPYQIGVTGVSNGGNPEFVVNIYPVPNTGHNINVLLRSPKTDPVLIEIIDAMGRLHYRKLLDAQTLMQGTNLIPASPLYNGIYFLRVTQADIRARMKIIVQD
ncbi:MAG: fibronectin type III domain-containing protein [Bacteroidota bacterium]|nr:fibronectin type III domain-containing protein [Bacteroidota bacterium]